MDDLSSLTKAGTGMDPVTASLLLGGANFLGGLFSGASKAKQAAKDRALKARELGIGETQAAPNIAHLLETSPMRDKVLHTLMARLGQAPQAFKPTDILGGTNFTPQLGGIDQGKLQGQMDQYTPGAGGVNPDLYKAMLARLGYMDKGGNVLQNQDQRGGPVPPPVPRTKSKIKIFNQAGL
jgi:hypothetical protein